jgi:hypothetical protein
MGTSSERANPIHKGTGAADRLNGSADADVFQGGGGRDIYSGQGGRDVYVVANREWNNKTVTDFEVGSDRIDLLELFASERIVSSDPIGEGIIAATERRGRTYLKYYPANERPVTLMVLQGVAASALNDNANFIFERVGRIR